MAKQTINVGTVANDGTGDTIRASFVKTNENFTELYTSVSSLQASDADLSAIAALSGTSGFLKKTSANNWSLDTNTYLTSITSGQVTSALGYTPYDASNPNNYTNNTGTVTNVEGSGSVSGLTLTGTITTSGSLVLGGSLTLTSANVVTALGFTPYDSSNPNGYITSANLSGNTVYIAGVDLTQNTNITAADTKAQGAFDKANSANVLAQAAFDKANTGIGISIDEYARTTANAATSNTVIIQGVDVSQNTRLTIIEGVNVGQNTQLTYLQSALNTANANIDAAAQTVPQNARTSDYVLQLTDAGKHIYYTQATNSTLYIPNAGQRVFPNGATIMVISQTTSSANVTVSPNTGVSLYLAGNTTSASRIITTYGMATLIQVAANTWFINGTGVV
jgi:hypothetical protein